DSGAVVPTAVENNDLPCRGKVCHVPLQVHLRFLPVRRGRQGHDPENTRTDALSDGADGAALARSIATFKQDDRAQAFVLHPGLELAQFALAFAHLLLVILSFELLSGAG